MKLKHSSRRYQCNCGEETNIHHAMKAQILLLLSTGVLLGTEHSADGRFPTGMHWSLFWESSASPYLISLKPYTRQLWHLQLQAGVFCENHKNSDDKSSQHYCRIREYGVLKCLTAVKRKKTFVGKKEIHNLCCKIEYSTLYFNSFSIYIYLKQRKDALFRSYMSALKITSCAKPKPSPVRLHNI